MTLVRIRRLYPRIAQKIGYKTSQLQSEQLRGTPHRE
jgi:hypothetical protein